MSQRPSVRLAVADDLHRYARRDLPEWCIEWAGYVAEQNDEIVAIGLLCWDKWGRVWAWYDCRVRLPAFTMHRLAKRTIGHLREIGVPALHAYRDEAVPNSELWLRRLGFRLAPPLPFSPLPVWVCRLN